MPGRYSAVMTHHPVPGGPQTGREEKATITVIKGEKGLPGNDIMRIPSCFCQEGWEEAGEQTPEG